MHHSMKVNLTLYTVPFLLLLCYEIIESADSLICWQCISDDCANDPSDNYKASKKICSIGQSCQNTKNKTKNKSIDINSTEYKAIRSGLYLEAEYHFDILSLSTQNGPYILTHRSNPAANKIDPDLQSHFAPKVRFEMYSPTDKRKYFSTVRGCASNCESKNDFENCTSELFNSRGCVEKHCCENIDLCNMASDLTFNAHVFLSIPLCHAVFNTILP